MTSSKRAPAWPRMACKRSKVRWVCGPMPPETSLPSVPRPVSPAVNRTREGLTLIPGMKPRPRSTGRSARISRRSMVPSFASRDRLRVGGAILRRRAQPRQGGLVSHREPFAVRSAQVESGRKGIAMDVMIVRVLIALVGVAVVLGGVLLVLSLFVPSLRFARGRTVADRDNETGYKGPSAL